MNEYTQQAESFMDAHGVTMTAQYLGHFPRLGEYAVSQWQVTFTRQGYSKPFSFVFSQSINDSWKYRDANGRYLFKFSPGLPCKLNQKHWPKTSEQYCVGYYTLTPTKTPPTPYDVLACLTKSDPGTFKDFCADFGYNDDSIKALETYRAVQAEWQEVERLFGDCLEELEEIN